MPGFRVSTRPHHDRLAARFKKKIQTHKKSQDITKTKVPACCWHPPTRLSDPPTHAPTSAEFVFEDDHASVGATRRAAGTVWHVRMSLGSGSSIKCGMTVRPRRLQCLIPVDLGPPGELSTAEGRDREESRCRGGADSLLRCV